jgi:hypothetical protein
MPSAIHDKKEIYAGQNDKKEIFLAQNMVMRIHSIKLSVK